MALLNVSGHHPIHWGLNWTKGGVSTPLLYLITWVETSYVIFSCPQTGMYAISSPGSQAFKLGLELNHQLSCVCILQVADHGNSQSLWAHEPIPQNKFLSLSLPLSVSLPISVSLRFTCTKTHINSFSFFWCGPFLNSLFNLLQYCFCFMFWFSGC